MIIIAYTLKHQNCKETPMNLIDAALLLILGFMIGTPMAMVGLGGGILIVPMLILVFGLPAPNAAAISLVAMVGTTVSASLGYIRQRRVDYKLSLLYDILDIPGVVAGAYLTTILPKNILAGLCGFFVVFISLLLIRKKRSATISPKKDEQITSREWRRRKIDSSNQTFEYIIRSPSLALISSFLSGLVGGLAGLGGGITDTTTMILLGVPPHIAAASSEFAMVLTNGVGVVTHGILHNILWECAIPLTIGTFIGAQLGVIASKRTRGETLSKILSLIALILGVRLILLLLVS
jgi:uncharacterized membrane protein YfcA